LLVPGILRADSVLADFNDAKLQSKWEFYNGPEFPGGTGSFAVVERDGEKTSGVGKLTMDLSKGGEYVLAQLNISPPIPEGTAAIKLRMKLPPGIIAILRLRDTSGQTLQYHCRRPVESFIADHYFNAAFTLDQPTMFWGGAGSGKISGGIEHIAVGMMPMKYKDGQTDLEKYSTRLGTLLIDEIVALDQAALTITGKEELIRHDPGKLFGGFFPGVAIHLKNGPATLKTAATLGLTTVRTDLFWSLIETKKGKYDFRAWDGMVKEAGGRGIRIIFMLVYGNPIHTEGDPNGDLQANHHPPRTAKSIAAFGNFAEAAAKHFAGKGITYEIWNEPNFSIFWPPKAEPQIFAELVKETAQRIRKGDPRAQIVSGGLSGTDFAFLQKVLDTGNLDSLKAVAVHPYDKNGIEGQMDALVFFQALLKKRKTGPQEMWISELGVSSAWYGNGNDEVNRKRQASLLSRQILTLWGANIPAHILYDLFDDGTDPQNTEHHFGIYSGPAQSKPAAEMLLHLRNATKYRQFRGMLRLEDTRVHALDFSGNGDMDRLVILWTDANEPMEVKLPASASTRSIYGQFLPQKNATTIAVGWEPTFVYLKN